MTYNAFLVAGQTSNVKQPFCILLRIKLQAANLGIAHRIVRLSSVHIFPTVNHSAFLVSDYYAADTFAVLTLKRGKPLSTLHINASVLKRTRNLPQPWNATSSDGDHPLRKQKVERPIEPTSFCRLYPLYLSGFIATVTLTKCFVDCEDYCPRFPA